MHQRRGLQSLARLLSRQPGSRKPPQFRVNERNQFIRPHRIALLQTLKESVYFGHSLRRGRFQNFSGNQALISDFDGRNETIIIVSRESTTNWFGCLKIGQRALAKPGLPIPANLPSIRLRVGSLSVFFRVLLS